MKYKPEAQASVSKGALDTLACASGLYFVIRFELLANGKFQHQWKVI